MKFQIDTPLDIPYSDVELKLINHLKLIQKANNIENLLLVKDFLINNWYMYDANWLSMILHMYETGRVE